MAEFDDDMDLSAYGKPIEAEKKAVSKPDQVDLSGYGRSEAPPTPAKKKTFLQKLESPSVVPSSLFKSRPLVGGQEVPFPGWSPVDERPWLVRKGVGAVKSFVGGSNALAMGLGEFSQNPPVWAMAMNPMTALTALNKFHPKIEDRKREWETKVKPVLMANIQQYGTPRPSEQSLGGNVVGMIPMVTLASIPGAGVPITGSMFAGLAQGDVTELNNAKAQQRKAYMEKGYLTKEEEEQTAPISPYSREFYTLMNAALAALPIGGKTGSSNAILEGARGAATGAALNVIPGAYRKFAFGTEEDLLEQAKEGAATMGALRMGQTMLTNYGAARRPPGPIVRDIEPRTQITEVVDRLPELLGPEGVSAREVTTAVRSDIKQTKQLLEAKAAEPNSGVVKVVDKNGRVRYKYQEPVATTVEGEVLSSTSGKMPEQLPMKVPPLIPGEGIPGIGMKPVGEPDALQEPSATPEVSRPGVAGEVVPEGGEGIRPGVEGEEIAGAGQAKEEVATTPKSHLHTALDPESIGSFAREAGFTGDHWDPVKVKGLDPAEVIRNRVLDLTNEDNIDKTSKLYALIPETEGGIILSGDILGMLLDSGLQRGANKLMDEGAGEAYFKLHRRMIEHRLKTAPGDRVFIMSGAQGSGKSTIASGIARGTEDVNSVIDTVGGSANTLEQFKEVVRKSGKIPTIILVERPIEDAVRGMVNRSNVERRAVDPEDSAYNKVATAKGVAEFKKNNRDVDVTRVTVNSDGSLTVNQKETLAELVRNGKDLERSYGELTDRAKEAYLDARKNGIGDNESLGDLDAKYGHTPGTAEPGGRGDTGSREVLPEGAGERGEEPVGPTAEEPIPQSEPIPEQPTQFTIGRGDKARKVDLETPEDQVAYQKAKTAHDERVKAIKSDPELQGEENKSARRKAYEESGNQFKSDKESIERDIAARKRQSQLNEATVPELEGLLEKAKTDGDGFATQEITKNLQDLDREARRAGLELMNHGVFNKGEWLGYMREEFGPKTFSLKQLNDLFRDSMRNKMLDPTAIRESLSKTRSFEDGLTEAAAFMAPKYTGGGRVPVVPERTMFDEPAAIPMRDLGKWEVQGPAETINPSRVFTGLLNFWKGGVFKNGQDPITDAEIMLTAASAGTNADQAWAADVLKDLKSNKERVIEMNRDLVKRRLEIETQLVPLEIEASEARGGNYAETDFNNSPEGALYGKLRQELMRINGQLKSNADKLAKEDSDTRVFMYLNEPDGSQYKKDLEKLMGPAEMKQAAHLRDYYTSRKGSLDNRGIQTRSDNYVPFSGIREIAPEELNRLHEAMAKYGGKRGPVTLPDVMDYLHRESNIPLLPSATATLAHYIPEVNHKLAMQPFLDRWNPAIDSDFGGKAPRAALYTKEIINGMMSPNRHSEALSLLRNLTFTKTLFGNLGTAVKHGFKVPLTFADHGPMSFARGLTGAADAMMPEKLANSSLVKRALKYVSKATGGLPGGERETALQMAQALGATKEMNNAIAEVPWLQDASTNRTLLRKINDGVKKANNIGTSPVRIVEQAELGMNVLASLIRARDAGIGSHEAVRGMINSVLANNFRGVVDVAPFLKTPTGQVVGMFQGTPLKITSRYLEYALLPDAVDVYGTKNGVKLARTIMILGAIAAAGKSVHSDFLSKAIHTPWISHGDLTGEYVANLGPLEMGGEVLSFTKEGVKEFAARQVPTVVTKAARIYTGDMPKAYEGSVTRYLAGTPVVETKEAMQKKAAFKSATRSRKSVDRNHVLKALRKAGLLD